MICSSLNTLIQRVKSDPDAIRKEAADGLRILAERSTKIVSCTRCELSSWSAVWAGPGKKTEWQLVLISCAGGARLHDDPDLPLGYWMPMIQADPGLKEVPKAAPAFVCSLETDIPPGRKE